MTRLVTTRKCSCNAFGRICLSVCLCLSCSYFWKTWHTKFIVVLGRVFRLFRQSSYIKVVGSRSRSQEKKRHTSTTKYIHLPVVHRRLKDSFVDSNFTVRMLYCDVHWMLMCHNLCLPASIGWPGMPIYFAAVLFFDTKTYRWESAQQAPADTIPAVGSPAELIKYPQTFDPCCPHFLQGPKCPKFRPQSSLDRCIFELGCYIGKQKQTCQGTMIGLPPYQTWVGWVPLCLLYTSDAADE